MNDKQKISKRHNACLTLDEDEDRGCLDEWQEEIQRGVGGHLLRAAQDGGEDGKECQRNQCKAIYLSGSDALHCLMRQVGSEQEDKADEYER